MRPSLATDRISLGFWLNISFVVNHRGAFRSIIAFAIDLLISEDQYFLWITAVPLPRGCLQSRQHSGSRMCRVTLALSGPPNLQPELDHRYLIFLLFRQPITSPKLYLPSVRSVVLVKTQLQSIWSPWETWFFFSASARTSNPPLSLLVLVIVMAGSETSLVIAQWLEPVRVSRDVPPFRPPFFTSGTPSGWVYRCKKYSYWVSFFHFEPLSLGNIC